MKTLQHPKDLYGMNWIEGVHEWGDTHCPEEINCEVFSEYDRGVITERYIFTNHTDAHVFTSLKDIAIYTPFNDDYISAGICMKKRCHTHIWCGGNTSYVMALRMGGEPPHLGMVLTKGSLGGYSVERDFTKGSNDRGDFMLHPSPVVLAPSESMEIQWKIFWHNGKEDFYRKARDIFPDFIEVRAERYVVFRKERIELEIQPALWTEEKRNNICISEGARKVEYAIKNDRIVISETADTVGEHRYNIRINGMETFCNIFVQEEPMVLAMRRCMFIADAQQYQKEEDPLDGAYLIYDNEEEHRVYHTRNDMNAGRERVGMGLLIAEFLKCRPNKYLHDSLKKYDAFVRRELFDRESGKIFNDYRKNDKYLRLYNDPWYSLFFTEMYELEGRTEYLEYAYKVMESFYHQGGQHFYAIEIPLCQLMRLLKREGWTECYNELLIHFRKHCEFIMETGLEYPVHEVNFEQSIVAPAADLLLQMYELTGEEQYLDGAKIQLRVLELFHGTQPDYHLYGNAIRHWDGYWFGKMRLFGDTFPHYWSALTGNVYERYGRLTGDNEYLKKAEASFRGVLSLFTDYGRGSCAYLYPVSVNGSPGQYYDAYANDQDWGLYFFLRYLNRKSGGKSCEKQST